MSDKINALLAGGRVDRSFQLSIEQYGRIRRAGLFTGSRKFGQHVRPDSDWDYVLHIEKLVQVLPEVETIDRFQRNHDLPERYQDDLSVFFTLNMLFKDRKINIIVVTSDVLLRAWGFATSVFCTHPSAIMHMFPKPDDKKARHLFFQDLKLSYLRRVNEVKKGSEQDVPY